jgi:hypothetical protein
MSSSSKTNKQKNKKQKTKRRGVFKEEDYNSGDGMLTTVWGPSMWHSLHTISFNYPVDPTKEEKKQYKDFILSLQYILPCKYCRINLSKNFKLFPMTNETMKNREAFSRYIYDLHEMVNKNLNKKSGLTYDDVRERYEHFRAHCLTDKQDTLFTYKKDKKDKTRKKDKGCVKPLHGKKSKCIIQIVPQEKKGETFQMSKDSLLSS